MASRWRRPQSIIRIAIPLCFVLMLIRHGLWQPISVPQSSQSKAEPKKRELSLLVPATQADSTVCKTLVSAAVLDYPSPRLVNFGKTINDPSIPWNHGTHLAKIPGVLSTLQNFETANDDQIVLVVDGLDTWFQLGPSVLLSRYDDINHRAYKRASQALCGRSSCGGRPELAHVNQQIIFSTQKKCWPGEHDDLVCIAPPLSTLPQDVFGPETDQIWPDKDYPEMKMRPRYLNSGFVIGPAAALKRLYEEAERRIKQGGHGGSDQGIFAEIFGEQEYARHLLRAAYINQQSLPRRLWWRLLGQPTEYDDGSDGTPLSIAKKLPLIKPGDKNGLHNLEYGISLDYFSELSHTMFLAHRDADWIIHDEPERPSAHWHIVSPRVPAFVVPDDVLNMPSAHEVLNWSQTPLFTNLYTGTVPLSMHHNAWQHGMKTLMWSMWTNMWWHNASDSLISIVDDDEETSSQTVPADISKVHLSSTRKGHEIILDNGTLVTLHQLCRDFFQLFELDVHLNR